LARIAMIGQQDFGKAALEAFIARGDTVVGVFCKPEKPGERPDALRQAAQNAGVSVFQLPDLKGDEAHKAMQSLNADICIMAYVLQFAPQSLVDIPKHGTIQYHPSLLPKYRGPSSINWPIAFGEKQTGLTIFRPTDGLDEGPVILQKTCDIGPDTTLGEVYFNSLFPMGVQALLEACDLVIAGKHTQMIQNESQASYQGWFRDAESQINWANHIDHVYNLIRACNPAPGAWAILGSEKVFIFDCKKHITHRFEQVKGKPGTIAHKTQDSFFLNAQGGQIEVLRIKPESGSKMKAAEFIAARPSLFQ
jgi:methionyl-tRNA formyltransferase